MPIGETAGLIAKVVGFFSKLIRFRSHNPHFAPIPHYTLKIVPLRPERFFWHQGLNNGQPSLNVMADFLVTNLYKGPVQFSRVELYHGRFPRKITFGNLVINPRTSDPNGIVEARLMAFITPLPCKPPEPFILKKLVVFDQFGNKHVVKRMRFEFRG